MTLRYTAPARWLHWVVAGLIVVQFVLALAAGSAEDAGRDLRALALLANHKSVGITILALALVRVAWRWRNPPPAPPAAMPRWQAHAADTAHWLMYGLLLLLPLSGWLMSSAAAYTVSWFNLVTLPDLIGSNAATGAALEAVHETLAWSLFCIALGHVGAALWHQLHDRDDILRRMTTPGAVLAGAVLMIAGVVAGWVNVGGPQALDDPGAALADAPHVAGAQPASTLPAWRVDHPQSHIRFSATQAGASFRGHFADWQGDIRFDPAQLAESRAAVTVNLASVATGSGQRDQTLAQPEWFGHGTARFRAARFEVLEDGRFRTADATLDFGKGPRPVRLTFTLSREAKRVVLDGSATLDRTALEVGTGEWRDTTWVGQFVEVSVHVEADEPDRLQQ